MKKKIFFSSIVLVVMMITGITLITNNSAKGIGYKIDFPISADESINNKTEFICNLDTLSKQITVDSAYVFEEPKKTDYQIVSNLGFNANEFDVRENGKRFYKNNENSLEIDDYGVFSYSIGVKSIDKEMTLNADECVKTAKEFLEKNNLFHDKISKQPVINEEATITSDNNRYITGRTITFYPKKIEKMSVFGNERIGVTITSEGKIKYVSYNFREYSRKQKVKLISMQEAYQKIKDGNAYIELESPSEKLVFEKVSLHYWDQARNTKDNLAMQPIYVFQGTSIFKGKEEPFSVSVQANILT